ncbi:hypothetical protein HQN90_05110 [Paenibacillus alba]|nr:hypothetical protein [Paenibacillus alba]
MSLPKKQSQRTKEAASQRKDAELAKKAVSRGRRHRTLLEPAKKAVSTREAGCIPAKVR